MITSSSSQRPEPGRILLVDDNELGLRARKVVLEELGYQVTALCCGVAALDQFRGKSFDLVVTDYKMPRLDGIELIARVREHNPGIPAILISGFADALGLNEANTGADVVIQKNSHEVSALTRAVNRLLARRLPRRPARKEASSAARAASAGF